MAPNSCPTLNSAPPPSEDVESMNLLEDLVQKSASAGPVAPCHAMPSAFVKPAETSGTIKNNLETLHPRQSFRLLQTGTQTRPLFSLVVGALLLLRKNWTPNFKTSKFVKCSICLKWRDKIAPKEELKEKNKQHQEMQCKNQDNKPKKHYLGALERPKLMK